MNKEVVPAILTVNLQELADKAEVLKTRGGAVHIDIMDGVFVPFNTFFLNEKVAPLKDHLKSLRVEFHLMVKNPLEYANIVQMMAPKMVIMHVESFNSQANLQDAVNSYLQQNVDVSLTSFPDRQPTVINDVDNYQIMGVQPGMAGQELIPDTNLRIEQLKRETKGGMIIAVDGGVNFNNARMLFESGASRLIMNSAFWKSSDPDKDIKTII